MAESTKTHKDMIRLPLAGITLLYGIGFYFAANWGESGLRLEDYSSQLLGTIALTILGYAVSIFVTGQLDDISKARLIFLRWSSPLPGGEAFSKWMQSDERIAQSEIRARHGPLPKGRAEQNRLWYKMYKSVAHDPAVEDSSKHYLLCRDASFLTLVMGSGTSAAISVWGETNQIKAGVIAGCVLVFLLTWRAARLAGYRLVKRVLIINPTIDASPSPLILER